MSAGTDANVFITLCSKTGASQRVQLRNTSKNNFERGQEDTFYISVTDIGSLSAIKCDLFSVIVMILI